MPPLTLKQRGKLERNSYESFALNNAAKKKLCKPQCNWLLCVEKCRLFSEKTCRRYRMAQNNCMKHVANKEIIQKSE